MYVMQAIDIKFYARKINESYFSNARTPKAARLKTSDCLPQ